MTKSLGLIESYGSGVGKAKWAMAENGKEKINFFDYGEEADITSVEIPICRVFADQVEKLDIGLGKTDIERGKTDIEATIKGSDFSPLIKKKMLRIDSKLSGKAFGRSDVVGALGCSPATGSVYIGLLQELKIVKAIKGIGKSRYVF